MSGTFKFWYCSLVEQARSNWRSPRVSSLQRLLPTVIERKSLCRCAKRYSYMQMKKWMSINGSWFSDSVERARQAHHSQLYMNEVISSILHVRFLKTDKWNNCQENKGFFLVADMRLYTLLCRLVGWYIRNKFHLFPSGFCITAPARLSATVLSCIRPCF